MHARDAQQRKHNCRELPSDWPTPAARYPRNKDNLCHGLASTSDRVRQIHEDVPVRACRLHRGRLNLLYNDNTNLSKTISFTAKVDKPKVCVDYVIVGDVRPDPDLTDPTPGTSCYDKGTKYNQEKELTTRQENCKFDGWYTNEDLTGKWTDGTALNKDMTLYGAWDCGTTVTVPNTAATLPLIILGVGLVIIAGGVAIVVYRDKKLNAKK